MTRLCTSLILSAVLLFPCMAIAARDGFDPLLSNPGFEEPGEETVAAGWTAHNWGPAEAQWSVERTEEGHSGGWALRAEAGDAAARPGAFTRLPLQPGRYALTFFARAEPGARVLVRAYLADRYSPPTLVTDQWTPVEFRHTVDRRRLAAEVNLQVYPGASGVVWFDDVEFTPVPQLRVDLAPDPRPPFEQPRLLYASAHLGFVSDTASRWADRGFSGFLLGHLLPGWDRPLAVPDGDPAPEEGGDLFTEARAAVAACVEQGLAHNGLHIPLTPDLPHPADHAGYRTLTENLRRAAVFARGAGLPLVVLDTSPARLQWDPSWPGYAEGGHTPAQLAELTRERWRTVGETLAVAYPRAHLALMPEGQVYYGPLWLEMMAGLLEGAALGGLEGDIHLMCHGTFLMLDPEQIRDHVLTVRAVTEARLAGAALQAWQERGRLALGAWPLGYYRPVAAPDGTVRGWSGRQEEFGDRLTGAFADKSPRYSAEQFRTQMAALRTFSDAYAWIYGHGSSWWHVSEAQAARYAGRVEPFPGENYLLPAAPGVSAYHRVAAEREIVTFQEDAP